MREAYLALEDLRAYLMKNSIMIYDGNLSNIAAVKRKDGGYKLVVIDGLGLKRLNFEFYLCAKIGFFAQYKTAKLWTRLRRDNFFKLFPTCGRFDRLFSSWNWWWKRRLRNAS
jgi:hypothetical protein